MKGREDQVHNGSTLRERTGPTENLIRKFFKVPEATSFESIYSKLDMRIFDEYTNFHKFMHSAKFNGCLTRSGTSLDTQSTLNDTTPSLIRTLLGLV